MDKDNELRKAQHNRIKEELSLSQGLRLLKIIEGLDLQPDTVSALRRSIMSEETVNQPLPVELLDERPGAQRKLGTQFAEFADTGTYSVPVTELNKAEPDPGPAQASIYTAPPAEASPSVAEPVPALVEMALAAELKLRHKIEAEQDWSAFRHEAWRLYEAFPRPELAARIVNLALLYGTVSDLEEVLGSFMKKEIHFYTLIDAELRNHLLLKLWQAETWNLLDALLMRKDIHLHLIPIERLYICWSYLRTGAGDKAYKYFRRYDHEISAAQKEFGSTLKCSESQLALAFGRAALKEGDEGLALRLLESISRHSPEFQSALDMLLDIQVERDAAGLCPYGQKLQKELDWRARIQLFDSFLLRIQRLEGSSPKERAALNELLKDPLRWLPEQAEAWQAMVELLLQYQKLEYLLPQMSHLFIQKSCQYYKPSYDYALWSPIRAFSFTDPVKNWFWHAVAMLHEFVWNQGQNESLLWDARRSFQEAADHSLQPLPVAWVQLHRSLLQWVSKTERLDEPARLRLLLLVRLVGNAKDIDEQDVQNYLLQVAEPSRDVMNALEMLAKERSQWGLELFILDRKALKLHYTNNDLARVWQLGVSLKHYDLCWRVASVIRNRQMLNEQLERHWQISGERRREFPVVELNETQVQKIVQSFEGYERRLIEGLVAVGPLIPELLAGLHPQVTPVKKPKSMSSREQEIQESLAKIEWLPKMKRVFSSNPSGLWLPKPPFFSSLLDSKWSLLFVSLAQRLGVTAWDWQLSLLHQQIENIIPRMMRGVESPAHGKVGRWLRNLSPSQRKAWYELAQLSRRFNDEEAQGVIGRFIARLATTLLQDHSLALQDLEKMRAPLRLRWDLEHWILSDTYGDIRRKLAHVSKPQFSVEVYSTGLLCPAKNNKI